MKKKRRLSSSNKCNIHHIVPLVSGFSILIGACKVYLILLGFRNMKMNEILELGIFTPGAEEYSVPIFRITMRLKYYLERIQVLMLRALAKNFYLMEKDILKWF